MESIMKEYNLELNYYDLLNLHKALLEAKFHTMPDNESVAGSPIVANIYIQVRDLLIESDKGKEWKDWFLLRNRSERRNQAIFLMKKCKRWKQADADEKCNIAGIYLAPFLYDEEELKEVIAEVDSAFEKVNLGQE